MQTPGRRGSDSDNYLDSAAQIQLVLGELKAIDSLPFCKIRSLSSATRKQADYAYMASIAENFYPPMPLPVWAKLAIALLARRHLKSDSPQLLQARKTTQDVLGSFSVQTKQHEPFSNSRKSRKFTPHSIRSISKQLPHVQHSPCLRVHPARSAASATDQSSIVIPGLIFVLQQSTQNP